MVAVCRIKTDLVTTSMDSVFFSNSKYFLRFVNIFALEGGFDQMQAYMSNKASPCPPLLVSSIMSILANTSPYLLTRFVASKGQEFAQMGLDFVLDMPADGLRGLSKETVDNIQKAVEQLSRRVCTEEESRRKSESFMLKIALIFVSTDNLERKIHGVTILGDIMKRLKSNKSDSAQKDSLTSMIEKENILEQIIKGHSQLITKSVDLFKSMFEAKRIDDRVLQLLWTTLRKADLETRNAMTSLLNDCFAEFSDKEAAFFVEKIGEIEPKQVAMEELDLLYKVVGFHTIATDKELVQPLKLKAQSILWRIATSPEVTNGDVVDKAVGRLITLIRTGSEPAELKALVDEAVANVQENRSALQSLQVISEVVNNGEKTDKQLVAYVLEQDILGKIFANLSQFKASIRDKLEKSQVDVTTITEANINQWLPSKRFTFEENILKRLRFIDLSSLFFISYL
jgi:hypothetical protein